MPYKDPAAYRAYQRAYQQKNRDAISAQRRVYYATNKAAILEKCKAYYRANWTSIQARNKTWATKNRERVLSYKNDYYRQNAKRLREYFAARRKLPEVRSRRKVYDERHHPRAIEHKRRAISELHDSYIKRFFTEYKSQLKAKDVTEGMIRKKREALLLRRLARQMKQELTKGD